MTGTTVVSSSQVITVSRDSVPLLVSCPPVAATNVPYSCGFASIPGSGNLDIEFDGGGQSYTLDQIETEPIVLGNALPRTEHLMDSDLVVAFPDAILEPMVLASGRAEDYTKITFVEWFAGEIGTPIKIFVRFINLLSF